MAFASEVESWFPMEMGVTPVRLFLLSPASCSGNRARLLFADGSSFALARQLRTPTGVPVGEAFAFISQLYFRGKLAYARTFARVPAGPAAAALGDGVFVITTSRGPIPWQAPVTLDGLRGFASVEMSLKNEAYRTAFEQGALAIAGSLGAEDEVVLLGSIASDKYVAVLGDVFGSRLHFPREFVGRGDMSRGGLLLRSVSEGRELEYIPIAGAQRHGARPPRLGPRDAGGAAAGPGALTDRRREGR